MSADGSVTMFWGDDEYKFRLAIGEFRQLQESVNVRRVAVGLAGVGPGTFLNLLKNNDAWPDDVRDVLRLGLIGAGMKPADAFKKMARNFDGSPLFEHTQPAFVVLLSALVGPVDDQLSKKKTMTDETSQSSSPPSTEPAQQ